MNVSRRPCSSMRRSMYGSSASSRISTISRSISPESSFTRRWFRTFNLKVAWTRGSAAARRPITGVVEGTSAAWSAEAGTEGSSPRMKASLASSGVGFRRLPTKLGRSDGILHLFHKKLIFGNRRTRPRVFEDRVSGNKAVDDADALRDFGLKNGQLKKFRRGPGLLACAGVRHFPIHDYSRLQLWIDLLSHFDQQQH